jgi:hypothetical protein
MYHKKAIVAALALAVSVAYAAPTGPVVRVQQETIGAPTVGDGTFHNYASVLSTDFEAPLWDGGASVCGDEFVPTCGALRCTAPDAPGTACTTNADCVAGGTCVHTSCRAPSITALDQGCTAHADCDNGGRCGYGVTDVCVPKNHAASQNCCPPFPSAGDPNEETGWAMSPSSKQCPYPTITGVHPFAGQQHMRFQYDTFGGIPPGCSGFGSACRQRAITAKVAHTELSRTTWSHEVAISDVLGSSMIGSFGEDTGAGSISLTAYVYWYYLGGIYTYNFTNSAFILGGYWIDNSPDYANHTIVFDPCHNTVTYSYGGNVYGVEPYYPARTAHSTNEAFYTTDHFGETIDIDNHFVTVEPCPDACCDGWTGQCSHLSEAECMALGDQSTWYENVDCDQLGQPGGLCSGAVRSNCLSNADCTAPETCEFFPPSCFEHTGACCDASPGAGGPEPEGVCVDGADQEDDCSGPYMTWYKNQDCADIGPCMEVTGACCNTLEGSCTDGTTQAECSGAQRVWSVEQLCADVACDAVLGACCDGDTFGSCTDTTQAGCTCQKCVWTKLGSCSGANAVTCTHEAIPTVSTWGLAVLTLLLLTGAKVYFGRRQAVA